MFNLFDFPDPNSMRGDRMQSSTAQQALFLMNSPLVRKTADFLSRETYQSESPELQVGALYRKIFNRSPKGDEILRALEFFRNFKDADNSYLPGSAFCSIDVLLERISLPPMTMNQRWTEPFARRRFFRAGAMGLGYSALASMLQGKANPSLTLREPKG